MITTPHGLLYVNLGTPEAPTAAAVRRYLRQFLRDRRVLDVNPVVRALLANAIIPLSRAPKSARAYEQVWLAEGSPLLVHSRALVTKVAERLGAGWVVELGMRYGEPSIEAALGRLRERGADRVVVLPAYPQYASSSTGTAAEEVLRVVARDEVPPALRFVEPFHGDAGFLDAFASRGRDVLDEALADHVLFSFHGLPERHLRKADACINGSNAHCFAGPTSSGDCCAHLAAANRHCYRAQCYATARAIAERLGLDDDGWSVSFQSRLGRTPWIKPWTDQVLPALAARGVKRIAVYCPSFVADCLETLEEVAIRGRRDFLAAGGEELVLVPSLNAEPAWAEVVVRLAREAAGIPEQAVAARARRSSI